uniref:Uncharacterized protein n=1 Tax=Rhizophora mucronata TaxID=61149 RepID=A0A2P2NY93_RHIMU
MARKETENPGQLDQEEG